MMEISRSISIFTNEQTNGQSICVSELFRWSSICEGETKFEEVLQSEFGIGKGSLSDDECEGKRSTLLALTPLAKQNQTLPGLPDGVQINIKQLFK